MQCFKRCVLTLLALGAFAAAAAAVAAYNVAGWLRADDPPRRADAIVVLGDEPTRALTGAELYLARHAPRVLLSKPYRSPRRLLAEREGVAQPWFEEAARALLVRKGVPESAIETFGEGMKSTAAEAGALRERFPSGAPTLLVVTSPYHVRRARLILADALPHARVLVVASRHETFPDRWWADREAAPQVLLECAKFVFYFLGGRFL
ncbi:MAG: YdcF family protein [Burkholderiales bacterium]|nr:YdcF family protein [Burkholderiales bacterium]